MNHGITLTSIPSQPMPYRFVQQILEEATEHGTAVGVEALAMDEQLKPTLETILATYQRHRGVPLHECRGDPHHPYSGAAEPEGPTGQCGGGR